MITVLNSLYLRLNITAILVLIVFLTAIGIVLDRAFLESNQLTLKEHVLGQVYQLINLSELTEQGQLIMPLPIYLPDTDLALTNSGVSAFVRHGNNPQHVLWTSPSLNLKNLPNFSPLQIGEKRWLKLELNDKHAYYVLGLGYQRTVKSGVYQLDFYWLTELTPFYQQISNYRKKLWSGLLGAAILLILTQISLLHWGLRPLRQIRKELSAIEKGDTNQITGHYPREINQLTDKINSLINLERSRQTRYRNALADLAHSLKTPLAVLLTAQDQPEHLPTVLSEQCSRMKLIVERQLQRAGAASHSESYRPIAVAQVADRISHSLIKVYRDKPISVINQIDTQLNFRGDEADLMEILGNVLDNAFKWCHQLIELHGKSINSQTFRLSIQDDGKGIDPAFAKQILQRGVRADQSIPGTGIGLSVVAELVDIYQGQLWIEPSPLGGASVIIELSII